MNFDFEKILFYAVVITGIISLFDVFFLERKRKKSPLYTKTVKLKPPLLIDYARSFFPVLFAVFLFRSFLFEPFRIPSASLEPTLLIGDFIVVNKYHYGLRWPVMHDKIMENHLPKRGDIMVFRWPLNPQIDFIKRVIGLPGDHISYRGKMLFINGEKAEQSPIFSTLSDKPTNEAHPFIEREENLMGVHHRIFQNPEQAAGDFDNVVVPKGMYFVMGDNRDDSADSRYWGFVPEANIVGKAMFIWMSFPQRGIAELTDETVDTWKDKIKDWGYSFFHMRFNRIGKPIE